MKVNNMNIKSSIMTDNKYISSLFKWSVLFRRRARKFAFKRNLFSLKNKKIRLKRLGFSSFFFSFFFFILLGGVFVLLFTEGVLLLFTEEKKQEKVATSSPR